MRVSKAAMQNIPVHGSFYAPFVRSIQDAPWERRTPVDPQYVRIQQDSKRVQGKHVTSRAEYVGALTALLGLFLLEAEFALITKGQQWHSKKQEWPRNSVILFLTPVSVNHIYRNDDVEGKGKTGRPIVSFPFSPFLLISKPKVESVGRMYMYIRNEVKPS